MASVEFRQADPGDAQQPGDASAVTGGSRALVPFVATLARRPTPRRSQPDSSFVTQLLATATGLQQQPERAMAAYRSVADHNQQPGSAGHRQRCSA